MDVRSLGRLGDDADPGPEVFASVTALDADGVIVCNRVKAHTDFRAPIESGLAKITAIGLGKHAGATSIHAHGTRGLAYWLPLAAKRVVQQANVLCGLAVLENARDETARIVAVPPAEIGGEGEAALLREARQGMASLPFDRIDVLIVDEAGKNISGTGMDTNVVGRMMIHGVPEFEQPRIRIVVLLDLTDESHGNGAGIGIADVITTRVAGKLDLRATYVNALTSGIGGVQRAKMPMCFATDADAICAGLLTCSRGNVSRARVVRIKNTLELDELEVSEALLDEVRTKPALHILSAPAPMAFDAGGNLQFPMQERRAAPVATGRQA
jgi:hypothetical protein